MKDSQICSKGQNYEKKKKPPDFQNPATQTPYNVRKVLQSVYTGMEQSQNTAVE